jgi:hypothetical protein
VGRRPPLQLCERGAGRADCAAEDIAYVAPPADVRLDPVLGGAATLPSPRRSWSPELWTEAGGSLAAASWSAIRRGRQRDGRLVERAVDAGDEVLREMNKTSTTRRRGASCCPWPRASRDGAAARRRAAAAQERMRGWLRAQGLREGDLTVVIGSGESRAERGKARALVELLRKAGKAARAEPRRFAADRGVDGTLVHRMTGEATRGRAFLKTGTLSDTRALAGYVRRRAARSMQ